MRLRAVDVRNWACIESLSLADLGDGIVVLHGPNRTGKSSLAEALRCCLLDLDHNNSNQRLSAAVPRRTRSVPQISVEFEVAGVRYRIAKAFSKNKDGFAKLEKRGPAGWVTLEQGKQANQRVRELIGVEKSTSGLFQILWLQQGDVRLPEKPDAVLTESLESVLGSMITGRDIDFKARLDKACERWFTPTMKEKSGAPTQSLAADLEAATGRLQQIQQQWADAEAALVQYEEALGRQPQLECDLKKADQELEQVRREREALNARRARHEDAVRLRDAAMRLLEGAQTRLQEWDADAHGLVQAEEELSDVDRHLQTAQTSWKDAREQAERSRAAVDNAEQALATHDATRAILEDRQHLVNLATQAESLDSNLKQIGAWQTMVQDLEAKLTGPPILAAAEIKNLADNRAQAMQLRASLAAAELQISIKATALLQGRLAIDGQSPSDVSLAQGGEKRWALRQQAELTLNDLAVIRISRSKEDRDLETSAQRLAELDRVFELALSAAQVDASRPDALELLTERRVEHEARTQQLQQVRTLIAAAAPAGVSALDVQREHVRAQTETVLGRRPELRAWAPNQVGLDQLRHDFTDREKELQGALLRTREDRSSADQVEGRAAQTHQDLVSQRAALHATVNVSKEKLGRQDRASLVDEVARARTQLTDAEHAVADTMLTELELAIDHRFETALHAVKLRSQRMRENRDTLLRLQTQLAGTEGLHQKRIQAEQAVNDLSRALAQERLRAQAHKHLKELFDRVRQEQVRRTVGPISERVLRWAKQLGVTDYADLAFGDQLLPTGLAPVHAPDCDPVAMERESHGTHEQLSLLIRLAVGGLLATEEPAVAILDDPLAHADPVKHRRMLDILARAAQGESHGPHPTGPLQILILTCHPDRLDYLQGAQHIDLAAAIRRGG